MDLNLGHRSFSYTVAFLKGRKCILIVGVFQSHPERGIRRNAIDLKTAVSFASKIYILQKENNPSLCKCDFLFSKPRLCIQITAVKQ